LPISPPYREIADLLRRGQVVPFLGAGASLGNRPPDADWDENTFTFLPRGDELSRWLADIIEFPSTEPYDRADLAKVSSYYAETSARTRLLDRLREIFLRESYTPSDVHTYLAELAKSAAIARNADAEMLRDFERLKIKEFKPLLIVTTNYDDLTEAALQALDCPYDLVVHPTDQSERAGSVMLLRHGVKEPEWVTSSQLYIDLGATTVVYKMHGTISRMVEGLDSFVVTEEDYIEFLSLMTSQEAVPKLFMTHFFTRQFLFLGYGMRDWNLRVMLKNLKAKPRGQREDSRSGEPAAESGQARPGRLKSWAIQKDPSPLETKLWVAREVDIYNQDLNEFAGELRKRSQTLVCYKGAED
jgi:SIR2-like domain